MNGTKAIWMHLLTQGGRWSTAEIADAVGIPNTEQLLRNMTNTGAVRRFEKRVPGDRVTFGVTSSCAIPIGVTIKEIAAVGVVKESA